jgi:hypothetical protein
MTASMLGGRRKLLSVLIPFCVKQASCKMSDELQCTVALLAAVALRTTQAQRCYNTPLKPPEGQKQIIQNIKIAPPKSDEFHVLDLGSRVERSCFALGKKIDAHDLTNDVPLPPHLSGREIKKRNSARDRRDMQFTTDHRTAQKNNIMKI